jgi:sugar phosphate isomerase/epimerase
MVSRAVSSWSLHRTLGRFVSGDAPGNGSRFSQPARSSEGLALLDLPAELRKRGFDALQICHFHLPSRSESYMEELRAALTESGIELEMLLIDDGDLTNLEGGDLDEAWIGGWLDTATALGARRARVCAGRSSPSPGLIAESDASGAPRLGAPRGSSRH